MNVEELEIAFARDDADGVRRWLVDLFTRVQNLEGELVSLQFELRQLRRTEGR